MSPRAAERRQYYFKYFQQPNTKHVIVFYKNVDCILCSLLGRGGASHGLNPRVIGDLVEGHARLGVFDQQLGRIKSYTVEIAFKGMKKEKK